MFNTEFIKNFMDYYDYPTEAKKLFSEVLSKLDENKNYGRSFGCLVKKFEDCKTDIDNKLLDKLSALAEKMGYSEYTLHFCFLLSLTEELKNKYLLLGIEEKIYYDTMADLKYKLMECIECEKVPGTFVAGWFNGFFRMSRVAYGRFQFEVCEYNNDEPFIMKCGKEIKKGDKYINFHIPSSGQPLTDDVRLDSYKKAYKYVNRFFDDKIVIFGCGSWLLYPRHREFLPEGMNILRFMDDFEIVEWKEREGFSNGWRVFGYVSDLPCEQLPRDTKLRAAYAQWLCDGNNGGDGFGLFAFDGNKILK